MRWKRLRGVLLRLVLNRRAAVALGLAFVLPSVWLMMNDFAWESAASDGFGLILGATGAALLLAGLGGRRPDWEESKVRSKK